MNSGGDVEVGFLKNNGGAQKGCHSNNVLRGWIRVGVGLALFILSNVVSIPPAESAPWWWANFTIGDGGSVNPSTSFERWVMQFINSAQNSDTVYIASFTWGTGTNEPINGTAGINNLYLGRQSVPGAAPVRVIADGDDLADINGTKLAAVPMVASPVNSSSATHNKVITLGSRAMMTGSANFTAGAYSNQPNNMVIVRVPAVAQAYLNELDDEFNNVAFIENIPSPQNLFSSPNGDRIEVFFAPDDNGNISLAPYSAGSALKDVIKYRMANANESVFYMINQFGMQAELANALAAASSPSVTVEGWYDVDATGAANAIPTIQGDHTARSWGAMPTNVQGHNKVMIFDMDIVATGSANYTYGSMRNSSGASCNIENLILIHDFRLARKYMEQYRRSMARLPAENIGQADSFEQTKPGAVTNLTAVDVAGTSHQLQVSWTGPNNNDLSRYYVFISPVVITSQKDIGDGLDDDADGYIDEDPVGDADGFSSGPGAGMANDDDADGKTDEDPWMYPEAQAKNQAANASVTTILSTVNAGDVLQDNTNYWIAVVAVDKHGNEGPVSIVGPVQSLPSAPGAQPAASVKFDVGAPDTVSAASTLDLKVGNTLGAALSIKKVSVDLGSAANSEVAVAGQTPPSNWSVIKAGNVLTYTAGAVADYIDPGETLSFKIAVTNAPNTGPTSPLLVSTTDANNIVISGLNAGFVTVATAPPPAPPGATNNVTAVSATDGVNTINTFTGAAKLVKTNITVNYTLQSATANPTSIWYDVNKNPDGPGGSATDRQISAGGAGSQFSAVIPGATDSAILNGAEVRFLVQVGTETYTNGGAFYKFTIDNAVTVPGGLSIVSAGFNDITVGWTPIADADFLQYDIFYSATPTITQATPSITVTNRTQSSLQIPGLATFTTYYFAIQARDVLGNVSGLSATVTGATRQGTNVTVNNASDGRIQITQFDGSGTLTDNAITVSFTLDKQPAGASDVQLWYDVGNNPDGPGGSNSEDRQIFGAGSGLSWQAVIPGADAEIVDGAAVKFVFVIGGQLIQNFGQPYVFRVVQGITQAPGSPTVIDTTGVGFTISWSPINIQSNFSGYRIFYATDTVTLSSASWGRDDDVSLYFPSARQTTITSLAPSTTYHFKIAGVDRFGSVGPLSTEIVGQTGTVGSVLLTEVAPIGPPEFVELRAMTGPVDISNFTLTDLDSLPAFVPPRPPLASSALTLKAGEYAVVWLNDTGTTEIDAVGDANTNGFRDIYYDSNSVALANDNDQVALLDGAGDTVDAVVYRGQSEATDIDTVDAGLLAPKYWNIGDSSGAVKAYTSLTEDFTPSIARKIDIRGNLTDNNSKSDWAVVVDTTPGRANRFLEAEGVELGDAGGLFVSKAVKFDGTEKLKGGPYHLKFTLNQHPLNYDKFRLWYDTGADPDGRSTDNSKDAEVTVTTRTLTDLAVDSDVTIPEAKNGTDIRFILTSENIRSTPVLPSDEIAFKRLGGYSYRFTVDVQGPDTPGGLRVLAKTLNGLWIDWAPIRDPGDFLTYIVYYDTAAVTTSSKSWSIGNDRLLANPLASSTAVMGLQSNVYYHFRLAAVDAVGNISGLSDTASETTVAPVKIQELTATDGINAISNFSGSQKLQQVSAKITVTFDRSVASPVLYWNTIPAAPADGPGGNADSTVALTLVTSNQYSCALPVLSHDSTVFFVFNTDAGVIRNGSGAFSYKVDGQAGDSVFDFKFATYFAVGPNRNTSITSSWTPVQPAAYPDFKEYRLLYQHGDTVTLATASVWGAAKAPVLSDIRAGGTAVQNLAANDTYAFGIVWTDRVGNMSAMSDTFRQVTVNATPYADPASDGLNVAHALDGTEWLRKTAITVTFEFSASPMDAASTVLKWNVGGAAGDPGSRTVGMTARPGNPLVYDGVIEAGSDPLVADSCTIRYALWADGIKFDNSGVDFKFNVDGVAPDALTGVGVIDDTTTLTVMWTPEAPADFATYRVRYRMSTSGTWTILDKSNKSILGNVNASGVNFSVNPLAHYYVNVTAVDRAGQELWQASDRVILRGPSLDPALTAEGTTLRPILAGSPVTLSVKLWDMNGKAWSGQAVEFSMAGDTGRLTAGRARTASVTTGSDGRASVTLYPDDSLQFYIVTASFAAAPAPVQFILFSLPDEGQMNRTRIYMSGAI